MSDVNNRTGTYAAVKFHRDTNKAIHNYLKDTKLPNAVRPDLLHTTLLYSRVHLPDYVPLGLLKLALYGELTEFDIWRGNDGCECLVLKYTCPELEARHIYLMETHKATYDFPNYTPHITLSYDIAGVDINNLPNIRNYLNKIIITEEYSENLDLDWSVSATTISKNK